MHLLYSFSFQIDPSLLQQTLQQGNVLTQQLTGDPSLATQNTSLQTADSSVPANVVIQPLSSLSLQPTVTSSANMTIGPISEQEAVLTTNTAGKHDTKAHTSILKGSVAKSSQNYCTFKFILLIFSVSLLYKYYFQF